MMLIACERAKRTQPKCASNECHMAMESLVVCTSLLVFFYYRPIQHRKIAKTLHRLNLETL